MASQPQTPNKFLHILKTSMKNTGKLTISHRSTTYPCSVPRLGRFAGAGRIGLTRGKDRNKLFSYWVIK